MRVKNETVLAGTSETYLRNADFPDWNFRAHQQSWNPPADVYETNSDIIVKVEIAGMETDDFNIDFSESILTIQGTRPEISEKKAFHRMELRYGYFRLRFEIKLPINANQIAAEYRNGFLTIRLPKAETMRVQINPE
ncbi:MAG: Hsp20/alpha crystallin family protein [Chloroflexi bacterium]|nr:Hsp20/alpha crystallin family protein [Chloroflexota bacterium]